MRIILDTNVVMSALLWPGPPYRLLETIRQNTQLQLYSSPVLLRRVRRHTHSPGREQAARSDR
jgi:predicted nucleic acid-binding protein